MRTLFKVWLGLTILSMTFYIPFYLFTNNAVNAVEELTPDKLIYLTGQQGQDPERIHNLLRRIGVDTSMELEDALNDNKRLSNIRFQYVEGPDAKQNERASGVRLVEAVGDIGTDKQMRMIFAVIPKRFLKSNAMVVGFMGIHITDGKHSFDLTDHVDDEMYLWGLFEKTGKHSHEAVDAMKNRFDLYVTGVTERERTIGQRIVTETPQGLSPPQNPADSSKSEFQPDYAALAEAFAPSSSIESRTVAGNPAPDKIVIFQYEGQPAYCADEGEDGANCRGDASTFIGSGTYKDYMDTDSPLCIAGEKNCKLPEFFPTDLKG